MRRLYDSFFVVLLGVGAGWLAHKLGNYVGIDAPWWAWAIMLDVLWALYVVETMIVASDKANLARFQALLEEVKAARRDLDRMSLPAPAPLQRIDELLAQPAPEVVTGRTPETDRWNAQTKQMEEQKKAAKPPSD